MVLKFAVFKIWKIHFLLAFLPSEQTITANNPGFQARFKKSKFHDFRDCLFVYFLITNGFQCNNAMGSVKRLSHAVFRC